MSDKKRERDSFRDRLRRLDGEISSRGYTVEIRGRSGATVRGAGKILLYSSERIRLGVCGGAISVRGEGLVCSSYCVEAVGIEGRIDSVVFETEGEE